MKEIKTKGVHFNKEKNLWQAKKTRGGINYFLGYYTSYEEACTVCLAWEKENPPLSRKPLRKRLSTFVSMDFKQLDENTGLMYVKSKGEIFEVLFDWEDYDLIKPCYWGIIGTHKLLPYVGGYIVNHRKETSIRLHRLILNNPKGMCVDHINGNPLDNRKINLRIVTHQQNNENLTKMKSNNTTGYRGVRYIRDTGKFVAYANKGRYTYIGAYDTAEEASEAVIEWRKENMPFSSLDQAA